MRLPIRACVAPHDIPRSADPQSFRVGAAPWEVNRGKRRLILRRGQTKQQVKRDQTKSYIS